MTLSTDDTSTFADAGLRGAHKSPFEDLLQPESSGMPFGDLVKQLFQHGHPIGDATAIWASITAAAPQQVMVGFEFTFGIDDELRRRLPADLVNRLKRVQPIARPSEPLLLSDAVSRAIRLHQNGFVDTSLDLIYDTVDEMILSQRFALLDSLLLEATPDQWPVDIILALLHTTRSMRRHLACRSTYVARAMAALRNSQVDPQTLRRVAAKEGHGSNL